MMPNHDEIYQNEEDQYELMISREDCHGNIPQALKRIRNVEGLDVVDLGAGTGRLSRLLAPIAKSVTALDESQAMLKVTADKLQEAGLDNWRTIVADHRSLPLADRCADVVVAGWTICYLASTNTAQWRENLEKVMEEIKRILRPGGTAVILETMGTGFESPNPPSFLKAYYTMLEQQYGFSHSWIRTDFKFVNVEEAVRLSRFFFGDELSDHVVKNGSNIVPGCTGIWWLHA
jgi:ubiquinone/menaquinone biosynthesis C-methylase UbiE